MRRILLPLLFLLATAASARPLDLPRPNEKWLTLRVDEFTFVSNVSTSETTEIARDLLRMRNAIGQLTHLKVRSTKPTRIIIFGSDRAFAPYREAILRQKLDTVRGLFLSAESSNFIVMKRDEEDIDRTIYHELTHYFVRNTAAELPLWVSEGIAEYYSTFRTAGGWVHIGRPIAAHVQWLRNEPQLITLRELFALTSESPIYNEGTRTGVFYAESWALFHYLMSDATRRGQFSQFLRLLGQQKPVEEAFGTAFQKTYAEVERELRSYVRRQSFAFTKFALSELTTPELAQPQPLSRDGLLFELGHLLAHVAPQEAAQAQRFFEEALAVNPSHSGAHADLGRLHHLAGRRPEAEAAFARAVELGSGDAYVHLLAGISAFEQFEGIRGNAPREVMLKARKAFERSAELDPTSARAWLGIGATYVVADDDPAPGIAALEKCLALTPDDPSAAFNLVQLYARADRGQDAQKLAGMVMTRDVDAQMKAHLRSVLAQMEANRVVKLVNEAISYANTGNTAKALEILDGALPQIADEVMRTRAEKLRAEFASRLPKR